MIIAIDLNGGDHAPKAVIKGIELALKMNFIQPGELLILGTVEAIHLMQREKKLRYLFSVICEQKIAMHDSMSEIIRKKKSAIALGLKLVKQEKVNAFVSAGNTSAMVLWGNYYLQPLKRKLSPAIAVPLPNEGGPCLLLDAGAIHNASDTDLLNCAIMGSIYAKKIWQLKAPIVRLLNIGREEIKGNEVLKSAHQLMRDCHEKGVINFQGNIEGDKIFIEPANVVVCPGELGNNTLKVAEGAVKLVQSKLGWLWKIFAFFYSHHKRTDYEDIGGAILLGVNGIEIIAHGKSQPRAIANAIRRAKLEVEADIISSIKSEIVDEYEIEENDEISD